MLLAAGASLMVALITGKVLSPQYVLWLLPLVPVLEGGGACVFGRSAS